MNRHKICSREMISQGSIGENGFNLKMKENKRKSRKNKDLNSTIGISSVDESFTTSQIELKPRIEKVEKNICIFINSDKL